MREIRQSFSEDDFKQKPDAPAPVTEEFKSATKTGKGKFIIIPAIVIGVLFWVAVGYFYFTTVKSGIDPQLMATATVLNKACPLMLNSETRMDKVVALPNKTLMYTYTLMTVEAASISDTIAVKEYMKPIISEALANEPMMATFKEKEYLLLYQYLDKNGEYLFSLDVNPSEGN